MKAAKPDVWMPFYVGDYLGDTMELTTEQHGAYLLLLLAAWKKGAYLTNNDEALASICKCDKKAWARVSFAVLPYFTETEDGTQIYQARQLEEYQAASKNNETQRVNGNKGGRPRKIKPNETQQKPMGFDLDNPTETPSHSPSELKNTVCDAGEADGDFEPPKPPPPPPPEQAENDVATWPPDFPDANKLGAYAGGAVPCSVAHMAALAAEVKAYHAGKTMTESQWYSKLMTSIRMYPEKNHEAPTARQHRSGGFAAGDAAGDQYLAERGGQPQPGFN